MVTARDSAVEVTIRKTVVSTGHYAYVPFDVPPGTTRVDVALTTDRRAAVGIGLFDARGAGYQSPGFRGVTGAERREVFVGLREATPGFTPGPIPAGRWRAIIPVFIAVLPTRVTLRIRLTRGEEVAPAVPGPLPGVVRSVPGWYRGDLHCHTEASSDAWSSGSALTPAGYADLARALGLDFLAMTDHNVISQNADLGRDAGAGVLLLAGEEMTNWFHGHATVSGIDPGVWFDFRQSPAWLPVRSGGARIATLVAAVRDAGGLISAAHPLAPTMAWQFLAEGAVNPAARTDALEVWNGRWQLNDEAALRVWHQLLARGWHVVANGGSDLHGKVNGRGLTPGTPTTVVHAPALARDPIIAALRAGRSFVTRHPGGVEAYLTASGPAGQHTYTGGRIYAGAGEHVAVQVLVRGGGGMTLSLHTRAGRVMEVTLDSDEQLVDHGIVVGEEGGFVRVEVRAGPRGGSASSAGVPARGRARLPALGMEAFTNPIWLMPGPVPDGTTPEHAPPPARRV